MSKQGPTARIAAQTCSVGAGHYAPGCSCCPRSLAVESVDGSGASVRAVRTLEQEQKGQRGGAHGVSRRQKWHAWLLLVRLWMVSGSGRCCAAERRSESTTGALCADGAGSKENAKSASRMRRIRLLYSQHSVRPRWTLSCVATLTGGRGTPIMHHVHLELACIRAPVAGYITLLTIPPT